VIADLSINYVERQALLCGFVVERLAKDYGIDLEVSTFTRAGEIEEGKIYVQVKACHGLKLKRGQASFPFRIDRRDLVSWLAQPMPVILVVYDATEDIAFWIYVQSFFAKRADFNLFTAGKSVTVAMPTANVLNASGMRRFSRFRNRILGQLRGLVHEEY